MNPEPQNFDQLCKLLTLKRYEAPPPRYFNDFSSKVIARLNQPMRQELSWWERLGFGFDLQQAVMCGVGVVVCGLLSVGLIQGMQIADTDGPGDSRTASIMGNPIVAGTPVEVSADSLSPWVNKQSSSPFNQFAVAAPVGFRSFGPFGN